METNITTIINNFLNENEEVIESPVRGDLVNMRTTYIEELRKPGCSACMKNSMRAKYSNIIRGLFDTKQQDIQNHLKQQMEGRKEN